MKTENWLQFQAGSCSPTGAKHNINGAGRILNRSQGFRARGCRQLFPPREAQTQGSNFPRGTMLRPSSPVHAPSPGGPAGSLGASLLRDACGAPDGFRCCGPLPAELWGFTWPQLRFKAGSRVGSRLKSLGQRSVVTAEKPPRLINWEFFCKTGTSPILLCHLKNCHKD